jgi:hypothetical protein
VLAKAAATLRLVTRLGVQGLQLAHAPAIGGMVGLDGYEAGQVLELVWVGGEQYPVAAPLPDPW